MTNNTEFCTELISQYLESLQGEFVASKSDFGCLIATPLIRPDGDAIEILVEDRPDGGVLLSDGGATFAYLYLSGLALSRRLQDDARKISSRYGIVIDVNELVTEVTDRGQVGDAIHNLVQAILNVAALIEKRRPYLNLKFEEEVEALIIGQGKSYYPDFQVRGDKELHTVKFHVNSGANLLVQPLSQPNATRARRLTERWYYYFNDIRNHSPEWSFVAILDDRGAREGVWKTPYVTLPLEGLATLIPWSQKNRFVNILENAQA